MRPCPAGIEHEVGHIRRACEHHIWRSHTNVTDYINGTRTFEAYLMFPMKLENVTARYHTIGGVYIGMNTKGRIASAFISAASN